MPFLSSLLLLLRSDDGFSIFGLFFSLSLSFSLFFFFGILNEGFDVSGDELKMPPKSGFGLGRDKSVSDFDFSIFGFFGFGEGDEVGRL